MSLPQIILLAIVQGLTEFLPVSSSGHLVVANELMESFGFSPTEDLLEVNIVLHLGTLVAILAFYFREVVGICVSDRRLIPLLVVGTIPAAVIGIPLKEWMPELLESPILAGCMFLVTAGLLIWASRQSDGKANYRELSYPSAIYIGGLQALALLPGVSRSGATIAGGLHTGLDRESAGTFAFLLAIPAIGGASSIELVKLAKEFNETTHSTQALTLPSHLAIGALVAFAVGWIALWWLVRWIRAGQLATFAWYLVPLGLTVIVWQLVAGNG